MRKLDEQAHNAEIALAAKALFGDGLNLQVDEKNKRMTVGPGRLTRALMQRFARDYYYPLLRNEVGPISSGDSLGYNTPDWERFKAGRWEGLLSDPVPRMNLCIKIANKAHDLETTKGLATWCESQALRAANRPIYVYAFEATKTIDLGQPPPPIDYPGRLFRPIRYDRTWCGDRSARNRAT